MQVLQLVIYTLIFSLTSEAGKPPIIWGCTQGAQLLTAGLCSNTGAVFPTISGTDNRIVRMNGTTGLQDSALTCDDQGNVSGAKTFTISDLTTDRAVYSDSGDALTSSATTATQLAYLSSFSSNLTTEGDIFYYGAGGTITRLPRGADNEVLTSTAGSINWEAVAGGSGFSTIDAPSGTDPVAGTTLALTSTSGDLTITGNSATDTVDYDVNWTNPYNDTTNEAFGLNAIPGTNGASAAYNIAIGNGATAGDSDSGNTVSIGGGASCSGSDSTCLGRSVSGTGNNQVIIGSGNSGGATSSVTNVGSLNTCTGDVCLGTDSDGEGSHAVAIGANCDIEADTASGICIGNANTVGDGGSAVGFGIAIGDSNSVAWGYGIAIGRSNACNYASVCLGRDSDSNAHGQFSIGGSTTITDVWLGAGATARSNAADSSINVTADTGTNIAGHYLTLASGAGTGTGAVGSAGIRFKTPDVTGSGSGAQSLTTKMEVKGTGVIYYTPKDTAPATCTLGEFYFDSSGAACFCTDASNTWTNTTGVGTCA